MATTGGGVGEGDARWATGTAKKLDREEVLVVDETDFFVSAIYIGGASSTGQRHQPVLKANFRQAKGRETAPLVPVASTDANGCALPPAVHNV